MYEGDDLLAVFMEQVCCVVVHIVPVLPSTSFVFLCVPVDSLPLLLLRSFPRSSFRCPTATLFVVFFGHCSSCRSFALFLRSSLRVHIHTLHFLVMQLRQPRYESEHLDRCHPGEVVFCVGYNCATDLSATAARGTLKEVLLRFGGRGRKETKKETKARLATVGGAWLRGYVMAVCERWPLSKIHCCANMHNYAGDAHLARACTNIPCMHILRANAQLCHACTSDARMHNYAIHA